MGFEGGSLAPPAGSRVEPRQKQFYCSLSVSERPLVTIRYDTRCYFNVRSKADISQLNLPHKVSTFVEN